MSAGFQMPSIGDMSPEMRQRLLEMLSQQPTQADVPDATPPGFSGFNPPDAPTNTMAMRLGAGPAAQPSLQDLPLPPAMGLGAPRQMPAAPLLAGTLGAPELPTAPPQAPTQPEPPPLAQMPTLLGLQPPQMPANGNNGRPAGIPPTATPANAAAGKVPDSGDDEDTPAGTGLAAPKVPTTYTGLPGAKPVASPAAVPGAPAPGVSAAPVPTAGAGPGSTAAPGAPSRPANASPAVTEPSIFKRLGDAGIGDTLLAMGGGLLSGRNFTEGLGNAFQGAARVSQVQSATQSANQLAQTKAQREQAQLLGNASIYKKYFPNATDQEAIAGGANSSIMTELMKRGLPATETYRTEKDDNGDLYQVNTSNNQRSLLKAGDTDNWIQAKTPDGGTLLYNKADPSKTQMLVQGQPARPLTEQEKKDYGIAPNTPAKMTPDGPQVMSGGVTVNMPPAERAEQSEIGKARGGVVSGHIAAGEAASKRIGLIDEMGGALTQAGSNITTGPLGEPMLRFKQGLGGLLGRELPGTSATELFNNTGPVLAGEAAKAITTRPAMIEFTTMLNAKPGLANSVEGNRAMLDVMRQRAVIDKDLSELAARSSNTNEFMDKRDAYLEAHPMINPFTKQPFGSASDPAPGAVTPAKKLTFDPKTGSFN